MWKLHEESGKTSPAESEKRIWIAGVEAMGHSGGMDSGDCLLLVQEIRADSSWRNNYVKVCWRQTMSGPFIDSPTPLPPPQFPSSPAPFKCGFPCCGVDCGCLPAGGGRSCSPARRVRLCAGPARGPSHGSVLQLAPSREPPWPQRRRHRNGGGLLRSSRRKPRRHRCPSSKPSSRRRCRFGGGGAHLEASGGVGSARRVRAFGGGVSESNP